MMSIFRGRTLALLALSVGVLSACSSDTATTSMQGFEALKAAKPSDGSVAVSLPMPENVTDIQDDLADTVSGGWKLSLEAPRATYLLGEPVTVHVGMQNISGEALKALPHLRPEFHNTTYTIVRPDKTQVNFRPVAHFCTLPAAFVRSFQPGETFGEDINLFAAVDGWVFSTPGEYLIRADYVGAHEDSERLASNSLRITVREGSAAEQAAAKVLMDGEAALLLEWGKGQHLTAGTGALQAVIAQYPDTVHALYAHYVLGNIAAQDFTDGKVTRAPRPAEAVAHLEPVRAALKDGRLVVAASMRQNALTQLATSYEALGRLNDARQVRGEL